MQKKNYKIIDLVKLFFSICIICLHTGGLSFFNEEYKFFIEKFIFRMAVPFFFICSGFFFGKKIKFLNNKLNINLRDVKKYCLRLIKPLIIFEVIYIIRIISKIYKKK